jgi:hypothetical protein
MMQIIKILKRAYMTPLKLLSGFSLEGLRETATNTIEHL